MLEINLIPEDLKIKTVKTGPSLDYVFFAVPALIAVLFVVHLVLGAVQLSRGMQVRALNKRLQNLEPQRKEVEQAKALDADPDKKLLADFMDSRILWSKKLNTVSLQLPPGVWCNEMSMARRELAIKGSVVSVSLAGNEIDLINRFMSALRNDKEFMKEFRTIELGPLNSRTLGQFNVQDYSITVTAKTAK
ncbi:MAG: hypothetical protein PHT59_02465 [Candidatus Omnitrophica bacterium]|nr:hypothetical protein [Candidatus Omnitrophota bacterium]